MTPQMRASPKPNETCDPETKRKRGRTPAEQRENAEVSGSERAWLDTNRNEVRECAPPSRQRQLV